MFTVTMTLLGIVVFVITLFRAGLQPAWFRLMTMTVIGFILDVIVGVIVFATIYNRY